MTSRWPMYSSSVRGRSDALHGELAEVGGAGREKAHGVVGHRAESSRFVRVMVQMFESRSGSASAPAAPVR